LPLYLADTSIWAWAGKGSRPDITQKLAQRTLDDQVATCVPVLLEALHKADTGARYETLLAGVFEPLRRLPVTEAVAERALQVQRQLAGRSHGLHRRAPTDFLIAAVAEAHRDEGVVLWAFDDDFRIIAEATGQPLELEASTGPGH